MKKEYRIVCCGNVSVTREIVRDDKGIVISINPLSKELLADYDEIVECQQQCRDNPTITIQMS